MGRLSTDKRAGSSVKYFDYTASLVYEKDTNCKKKANGGKGFVEPLKLTKPMPRDFPPLYTT